MQRSTVPEPADDRATLRRPFRASATKALLGVALVVTFTAPSLATSFPKAQTELDAAAGIAAVVSGLLLAWWFIDAFVNTALAGDRLARRAALRRMFGFTYAFTFLALAILLLPFMGLAESAAVPDRGPIRLVRGCVLPESSSGTDVATRAPVRLLPGCTDGAEVHTLLLTIGGIVGTVVPEAAERRGVATRTTTVAGTPERLQPDAATTGAATVNGAAQPAAESTSAPGAARVRSSTIPDGAVPNSERRRPVAYQIESGFVVPLFVAVLALFGGAINLMRRLPELQKRSHEDFGGTAREPPLQACEARELVVFQILQLISAPFIATVAFYAIDPQSLSAAVALSFLSGFWSEGILLRIRAVVEGPDRMQVEAQSPVAGAVPPHGTAELRVQVRRGAAAVEGARVTVRRRGDDPGALHEASTDAHGIALFAALPTGAAQVRAAAGTARSAEAQLTLQAGAQHELALELPAA